MACSRDEAMADLGPVAAQLEQCIRGALDEYASAYAPLRYKHSKRTQASIIHDLMVSKVTETFGAAERGVASDIAVHSKGNLRLILAGGGKYKIKLKKLDSKLAAKNIPTGAALRFVWQQLSFVQVPASTNLHLGYQIANDAELTASKVWITCPSGNTLGWEWELAHAQENADTNAPAAEVVKLKQNPPKKKRASLKKELVETLTEKTDGTADKSE